MSFLAGIILFQLHVIKLHVNYITESGWYSHTTNIQSGCGQIRMWSGQFVIKLHEYIHKSGYNVGLVYIT